MDIRGLHYLAKQKRQQAEWNRAKAAATHTDPRLAHECEASATALETEAATHDRHAKGNTDLIINIESLIHYINHSPDKSAYRTLALRDLESASMRLRRELGDHPLPPITDH